VKEISERDEDENRVLFVGIAFERKGGKYLLEAFTQVRKEIRNAKLTIIGPKLDRLPEGVECLNYISKFTKQGIDTLLGEYVSSSVFVLPSLYEPFGIAFLEAMAHRLPCVGTNVCAMPEIIDHGVNGFLVPPRDSRSLANCIIGLLKDRKARKEMGDNAYTKYMNNYTWDQVIKKMVESIPIN
jgi:glycosyltransferase involved in cell wall biosynthesis